ncbi:hypothetical protein TVAG_207580 [Trichomonas vaginalis G3]|uniref:Uncharacterized protein n=1 Tax=Trichomonas vaginalis (strain ATCC PRA-98 / G3) TaxID=412133 RepID=A2F2M1_TRIV3|nr:hypothetical protein TVAGG3_0105350 [Trichomonas vaginalis G3]EAY00855.1 hypothetical protein TVAG_207580 [Trichomonas vaginalis G3]KAI5544613.1 hypothetical protein TVAGG3_0105350 [Trichomonas vaginalis G3]|eukprot:XP_001313784.1 hypothetical protein [Trichomonas vaginalis G3]
MSIIPRYLSEPAYTIDVPSKQEYNGTSLQPVSFQRFSPKFQKCKGKFNYNSYKNYNTKNDELPLKNPLQFTFKLRRSIPQPINPVYCKDPMNSFPNLYTNKYQIVPYAEPFQFTSQYPDSKYVEEWPRITIN